MLSENCEERLNKGKIKKKIKRDHCRRKIGYGCSSKRIRLTLNKYRSSFLNLSEDVRLI